MQRLPIDDCLPKLIEALRAPGRAVLQAPPGAGKTTRVPLAMLDAGLTEGRIVMLEPRRLAARAAAERLAEGLGEAPGGRVGYRMRGANVPGQRIEVVTEGILTRMLQSDPDLPGIGAVIFDEFHERSLNADLGLALVLEARAALRPDLILLAMSATLDAGPVAELMDAAPVITSQGRSYPVETRFLDTPVPKTTRLEAATARLIERAVAETTGGVLAFLPGEGEIRRTMAQLSLADECEVRPLFGALPFAEQRAAIAPVSSGRKVVLATSIAETSLTIEDIRVVVDAGRARRARFDPGSGMSRLVTEPVSRAEATQRAGRAGRVAEGVCYKLWTKGADGALPGFAPPEIEAADLTALALELALWGSADLPFLTPPPPRALDEARALLRDLGALDGADRITPHGRALARLPLHPRLGHMLQAAGKGGHDGPGEVIHAARDRVRAEAKRLAKGAPRSADSYSPAQMAALAYPDRVGLRRAGDAPRYVLSGGKGAVLDGADPLAGQRLLVVTDTDGNPREARIRAALPLTEGELRTLHGSRIAWQDHCLVLDDRRWSDAPPEAVARAMLDGIREIGVQLSPAAERFRARVALLRAQDDSLPDMADAALLAGLEDWLLPYLKGVRSTADWKRFEKLPALEAMLDWPQRNRLDQEVPATFTTPLGRRVPIDYEGESPEISLRLQEMFGQTSHPTVAGRRLCVTLLSPAGRPLQTTMDLPGFWARSYADVRKDMRGQYPRHPWPEDPTQADPTLRAKRRG
jgi:ATP-dependent helicase HrpB